MRISIVALTIFLSMAHAACGMKNRAGQIEGTGAGENVINGDVVPDNHPTKSSIIQIVDTSIVQSLQRICSGVIISENAVLTATHCLYYETSARPKAPESYRMRDLTNLLVSMDARGVAISKAIIDVRAFPLPTRAPNGNDLALLRLEDGIPRGITPATLLGDSSIMKPDQTVFVAGYGKVLTNAPESVVSLRSGTMVIKGDFSPNELELKKLPEKNQITCNGDSGGPAFVDVGGKFFLWGINRGGDPFCSFQSVFTKAYNYAAWIESVVEEWRGESRDVRQAPIQREVKK